MANIMISVLLRFSGFKFNHELQEIFQVILAARQNKLGVVVVQIVK